MSLGQYLRQRLFGISPEEATFARRGFPQAPPEVQDRLEQVGRTFIGGYLAALDTAVPQRLERRLEEVELPLRGFAYEGAAMGLGLLDFLTPWKRDRWRSFLDGPGDAHAYMLHVGLGWAAARLPWVRRNLQRYLRSCNPLLRWLVFDGYGFHEGYFHASKSIRQRAVPHRLSGYGARAFDQGLGRSLWFVEGADVVRVVATIETFPTPRRADLFSGVGLACAYAGGIERSDIERLGISAGRYRSSLAQGTAFAAKARQRARNMTEEARLACEVLCGMSAEAAAAITDRALVDLPSDDGDNGEPAYEVWKRRIRQQMESPERGTKQERTTEVRTT